ncbi:HotDog domain-containing protein [Rostrohypoxylon terebratum]|nr:HotDog domain-containing protein [Rostrohypoxylon terebratum]
MMVGVPRAAQACLRSAPFAIPSRSFRLNLDPATRISRVSTTPLPLRSQFRAFTNSRHLWSDQSSPRTPDAIIAPSRSRSQSKFQSSTSPRPKKRFRRIIWLLLGFALGTALRFTLSPPPPPPQGSTEDALLTEQIRASGSSLPLVRSLSQDPNYTSWDAYSGFSTPSPSTTTTTTDPTPSKTLVQSRITSGPLSGSRGLPFQRIFHNAATGEIISVLYFGSGTGGWPGVVHGGALATLLDESLGRCAILRFPARTGVTARLELQYRQPTLTSGFYVIRARPMDDERDSPEKRDRKLWVEGTLETMDGNTCVEAKALFVVPKGVKLKPLVEGF